MEMSKKEEKIIDRFFKLEGQLKELNIELDKIIEDKLGDGWGIVQQTDGICMIDINSNNYAIPKEILIFVLKLDRESAIKFIQSCEI